MQPHDVGETVERPIGLLITAVIEGWFAVYVAWTAPGTLKQYSALFKGFGAELPGATLLALQSTPLWYLLALVGIAQMIWVIVRSRSAPADLRRKKWSVRIFGVVAGVAVAFAVVTLYLPIFRMGAAV